MAVPKKKTSKSKKNIRKNSWKNKISKKVNSSLSLGKSLLTDIEKNFLFTGSLRLD